MQRYNEAALTLVLADVTFIETEIQRLGRPGLDHVFDEVKLVSTFSLVPGARPERLLSSARTRLI